jgi:hypothetical protein
MTHSEIVDKLQQIRPGAHWALTGTSYETLTWLDEQATKPSAIELGLEGSI